VRRLAGVGGWRAGWQGSRAGAAPQKKPLTATVFFPSLDRSYLPASASVSHGITHPQCRRGEAYTAASLCEAGERVTLFLLWRISEHSPDIFAADTRKNTHFDIMARQIHDF